MVSMKKFVTDIVLIKIAYIESERDSAKAERKLIKRRLEDKTFCLIEEMEVVKIKAHNAKSKAAAVEKKSAKMRVKYDVMNAENKATKWYLER